ncbi:hypothetical protein TNCV_2115581 [Trichonephila clavipes]|nr:hypothetical protein TNCV_2115581 [Trichonephila clavipes]
MQVRFRDMKLDGSMVMREHDGEDADFKNEQEVALASSSYEGTSRTAYHSTRCSTCHHQRIMCHQPNTHQI